MPSTVRTVNRLYTLLIGAVVIIAALVIAVFALVSSNQTAGCVNRVLGERAKATSIEQDERLAYTQAQVAYLRGRISKAALVAAAEKDRTAQIEAERYRAQHPAGRC